MTRRRALRIRPLWEDAAVAEITPEVDGFAARLRQVLAGPTNAIRTVEPARCCPKP